MAAHQVSTTLAFVSPTASTLIGFLRDRMAAALVAMAAALVLAACGGPEEPQAAVATPPAETAASRPSPTAEAGGTGAEDVSVEEPERPPTKPPLFLDVTGEAGVAFQHHEDKTEVIAQGGGVVVFDYNGDRLDDLYVSDSRGPNALFHNNGDGTFTDVAAVAGVDDPFGRGNGGCAADYDNDGDQDLYATNYGSSKLFVNNGDGRFVDWTSQAKLDDFDETYRSTGCAWGDYDRDGLLDFIVVRHLHERTLRLYQNEGFVRAVRALALYHNNGDGTLANVTRILGDPSDPGPADDVGNLWGAGFQPGWVDFDNDRDLDLYVVNDYGPQVQPNTLWRNDGPAGESWRFVDISTVSGSDVPMFGMGLAVADYNLDGTLDFFVTNIGNQVLLSNQGDGATFTNTTDEAGVAVGLIGIEDRVAWGTMFLDYDNDGREDLYVVSGYLRQDPRQPDPPDYAKEQHNVLFHNNGDGTFGNVSLDSGADDPGIGRGGAFLDFDGDGCLDLFVANLGQVSKLFRNVCDSGNNWLVIDTVGTRSNRDGIGARITVEAGGSTQIREIASGRSNMGQNMLAAHFGLGSVDTVGTVTVSWPSGTVQTLSDVVANQRLAITEPPS